MFPIGVVGEYICKRMKVNWELKDHHFADDPELMLNIVDNGALQLNAHQHGDQKLERDHIFPRKVLTDYGLGDLADHVGNYRLVVMPINRRKKANMPTTTTDFYGRQDETLEPLYQAAIENLTRETFQSFRDERASHIITVANEFLDLDHLDQTVRTDEAGAPAAVTTPTQGHLPSAFTSQTNEPPRTEARIPGPLASPGDRSDTTIAMDDSEVDLDGLRSAYQDDAAVQVLVDHFASRQRNQAVSPVDTLERALAASGTPLARHIIIDALRRLDAVSVGRFIPGRHGYPTRFEWTVKSLQTRTLATGDKAG